MGGGGGRGGKRDTVPVPKVKEREQGAAPPARKPSREARMRRAGRDHLPSKNHERGPKLGTRDHTHPPPPPHTHTAPRHLSSPRRKGKKGI